jgi:hypothetical protein
MSAYLAVAAFAGLFVLFGLTHRPRPACPGEADCEDAAAEGGCGACTHRPTLLEPTDARS